MSKRGKAPLSIFLPPLWQIPLYLPLQKGEVCFPLWQRYPGTFWLWLVMSLRDHPDKSEGEAIRLSCHSGEGQNPHLPPTLDSSLRWNDMLEIDSSINQMQTGPVYPALALTLEKV